MLKERYTHSHFIHLCDTNLCMECQNLLENRFLIYGKDCIFLDTAVYFQFLAFFCCFLCKFDPRIKGLRKCRGQGKGGL